MNRYWPILLLCLPLRAQSEPLTLPEALEHAQAKSPEIRALENQFDSARAKKRLALSPSEPTLSIGFNDLVSAFNLGTTTSNVYTLTQPLGFPGRALLNRSALDDQAQAVYHQLRATRLQISANVKQAYYQLALAIKNSALNADTTLAYERILAVAKRRYEAGQTSQVDYLNSQVALLNNQNDLADLKAAEKVARATLNVLLGNPPEAALEVAPIAMTYHPEIQRSEATNRMLENRAEIQAARKQANAASKSYDLAWMSILPDFQLTAGTTFYNAVGSSPLFTAAPDVTHTYMAGIQFTVPIWFLFNEREAIVGASHDRAAADANLDIVYNQSKVTLETTIENVNALQKKIQNYEAHLLPLSEQAFNIALISYSAGKIDFQTLSDTAASRRLVRQNYAQAMVSYFTNYTAYGQLIGEDL